MRNDLWRIFAGLGAAFGVPWLFLVVVPYLRLTAAEPVAYSADEESAFVGYPDPNMVRFGESDYGAKIYGQEGCAYCHTQVVRPTYAGPDMWREGWGGRKGQIRETRPGDYLGEGYAYLGYQRIGPDLSNVGTRIAQRLKDGESEMSDRQWHHLHLFAPRQLEEYSIMPSFSHLYKKVPASGRESGEALPLEGKFAPEEGFVIVPTPEAEALVDYLLSRRKDTPLPNSMKVAVPASAGATPAED